MSDLQDAPDRHPPRSRGRANRWLTVLSAVVLLGGFVIADAMVNDGVSPFLVLLSPLLVLAYVGFFALVHKVFPPGRRYGVTLLLIAVAAAAYMTIDAHARSRPSRRFAQWVLDPVPADVRNVQVRRFDTFSDGYAVVVAFDAMPATFEQVRRRHGLEELPFDRRQRQKLLATCGPNATQDELDAAYPEDRRLIHYRPIYQRPARPRFFRGERVEAVTDESQQRIFMYFDRFVARHAPSSRP